MSLFPKKVECSIKGALHFYFNITTLYTIEIIVFIYGNINAIFHLQ